MKDTSNWLGQERVEGPANGELREEIDIGVSLPSLTSPFRISASRAL
jgi:hypothetical protein